MSYEAQVAGWHDFYIVAGTASATLVGLLFVGLSLHLQIVVSALEVRSLARVTLANFGAVLVVALFMVIPQGPSAAGSQLVGAGVVSLFVAAPSLVGAVRSGAGRTLSGHHSSGLPRRSSRFRPPAGSDSWRPPGPTLRRTFHPPPHRIGSNRVGSWRGPLAEAPPARR